MTTNDNQRKKELTEKIEIRVSPFEKNRIKWLAEKYAKGNVSLFLIYHGINAIRKEIDIDDLKEYSKRRKSPLPQQQRTNNL